MKLQVARRFVTDLTKRPNQDHIQNVKSLLSFGETFQYTGAMKAKSWKFWTLTGVLAFVLVLVAAMASYALYYKGRALPGTSVAGQSVSGMTPGQLTKTLQERARDTEVTIDLDGAAHSASLAELGYSLAVPETVDRVFSENRSIARQFRALFSDTDVAPAFNVDEGELNKYSTRLAESVGAPAVNARIILNDEDTFEVEPASEGLTLDTAEINSAALTAAETLSAVDVAISPVEVSPTVSTSSAEQVSNQANTIVSNTVELTTTMNVYEADAKEKASWIEIPDAYTEGAETDGDVLTEHEAVNVQQVSLKEEITIDEAKVSEWVSGITQASNDEPQPGIRNINSRGDVVSVVTEGSPGWTANNEAELTTGLLSALSAREPFSERITYDEVENTKWEEQLIADGAENLAYQAAEGEKWIDINLSNYTTTAYEGATVVRGPVSMVPGAPGTDTVTGQYKVWAKVPIQTMRGDNLDGTRYETPDVPWILYFHGGYALHGAYWRSSFGYGGPSGSHGCINMPVSESKWFYDWASVGTPVVSHF